MESLGSGLPWSMRSTCERGGVVMLQISAPLDGVDNRQPNGVAV